MTNAVNLSKLANTASGIASAVTANSSAITALTIGANSLTVGTSTYVVANGNVGIGTNSPSFSLDVDKTTRLGLGVSPGAANNTNIFSTATLLVGGNGGNYLSFGQYGSSGSYAQWMQSAYQNPSMATYNLAFQPLGGNIFVGAASQPSLNLVANAKLYVESSTGDYSAHIRNVNASAASNYGVAITYSNAPNNSGNSFLDLRDSSAQRFAVTSNGGIKNFQANDSNLSDQRLKKDIKLAGSYLDKICAIPVKTFLYKDQTDNEPNLGVIAQDVEAVAPELVDKNGWADKAPDGSNYLSIYQTDLQFALMKCIQEQQKTIESLQARIDQLEKNK